MSFVFSNAQSREVLKIKGFLWFLSGRFSLTIALQMTFVIVGWQVYEITKDPLALGLIGLSEALAFFSVALFAGYIADSFKRKKIILVITLLLILEGITLFLLSYRFFDTLKTNGIFPIYIIMFMIGASRGFIYPAVIALMGQLVPRNLYATSSAWNSLVWHIAAVTGPAIGGLVYGFFNANIAYITCVIFALFGLIFFLNVPDLAKPVKEVKESLRQSILSGVKFVFKSQHLLGTMSLDMFAVLFGGVTALLPVFAAEILDAGPKGLGLLRAAPAIGSVAMSLYLTTRPPADKAGKKLFFSIACFGLCIICFALSSNFYLSVAILIISGMADNMSVVIRNTVLQLYTPDNMRGRVAAVNSVFIGSSNEIGAFESGLAAKVMGLVPSVIFGGSMTLFVVGVIARLSPALRKLNLKNDIVVIK